MTFQRYQHHSTLNPSLYKLHSSSFFNSGCRLVLSHPDIEHHIFADFYKSGNGYDIRRIWCNDRFVINHQQPGMEPLVNVLEFYLRKSLAEYISETYLKNAKTIQENIQNIDDAVKEFKESGLYDVDKIADAMLSVNECLKLITAYIVVDHGHVII